MKASLTLLGPVLEGLVDLAEDLRVRLLHDGHDALEQRVAERLAHHVRQGLGYRRRQTLHHRLSDEDI